MKKIFNTVVNIEGKEERYPIDKNGAAFFITDDNRFFIYALYTKKNLTNKKLIEVDYDTYISEVQRYRSTHNEEPAAIILPSRIAVEGFISFTRYKATVDNTSLDDLYKFSYKGD